MLLFKQKNEAMDSAALGVFQLFFRRLLILEGKIVGNKQHNLVDFFINGQGLHKAKGGILAG